MFGLIVYRIKSKGWIYVKGDCYYCYKSTVKEIINPKGYDLDI